MSKRSYVSNLSPAWSVEKQEAMLGNAYGTVFRDILGPKALKDRDVSKMLGRAELLRSTGRNTNETITVASFAVLAWTWQDFGVVITAASGRQATLHALDTGWTLPPHAGPGEVIAALEAFRRVASVRRMLAGRDAVAAERKADTERRVALIADDWPKPKRSTPDLLMIAGPRPGVPMAPATARAHLGSRPKMQAAYSLERVREAGRVAGRAKGKEATAAK